MSLQLSITSSTTLRELIIIHFPTEGNISKPTCSPSDTAKFPAIPNPTFSF